MKCNRHGKSAPLTDSQLERLIENAPAPKYAALWTLQRYTACRISEGLSLRWSDTRGSWVTFRKGTTKTKRTHQVPQVAPLKSALEKFKLQWEEEWGWTPKGTDCLFTGPYSSTTPLTRQAADHALRKTLLALGIEGVSTHSFRRSLAQKLVAQGTPLSTVQQITGHRSLGSLGEYLQATEQEVLAAIYQ